MSVIAILIAMLWSDTHPRPSTTAEEGRATISEAADYAAVQREIKAAGPKIRVVNLWATWCGPCVAEMADLQKIANRFPRMALIGISLDDAIPGSREETRVKVAQFLRQHGVKYRNVYFTGRQSELTDRFNFEGELPVTFVYSSDGKELTRVVGQLNYDSFTKTLAALEKQQKR
jgi:thiol-disulfide isomerase/thioredoxin